MPKTVFILFGKKLYIEHLWMNQELQLLTFSFTMIFYHETNAIMSSNG